MTPDSPAPAPRRGDLRIHYRNAALAHRYAELWLWCWGPWPEPRDLPARGVDGFGAYWDVPQRALRAMVGAHRSLGFKPKDRRGDKDAVWFEFDRHWRRHDSWEVYVVAGDATLHPSLADALRPRVLAALIRDGSTLEVRFDRAFEGIGDMHRYTLDKGDILSIEAAAERATLRCAPLNLSAVELLRVDTDEGEVRTGLYPAEVMDSFDTKAPLGASVDALGTHFALWAPRASEVVLEISRFTSMVRPDRLKLSRAADGVWRGTLPGNRAGHWYWYRVDGPQGPGEAFHPHHPVNDPWSPVALRSGPGAGPTQVVHLDGLPRPRPLARRPRFSELVAWEVHVRDMTGGRGAGFSSSDPERRSYLGFVRQGTRGQEGVTTGLDHLSELGINAVQLLPLQEYPWPRDSYRWGYITANFLSPSGNYASDEGSEARLLEVIHMVDALHARGIAVICDVVFNHTAEGDTHGPTYNLRGMDSKYFYRQSLSTFDYFNGSGCGNELATERPMARRLIVDACRFWVEVLGVDGFRFDLASLIDLQTLSAVADALPPDVLLYGEPWSAGRAFWGRGSLNHDPRWSVFDDTYRDAIKGPPEGPRGGFVQGQADPRAVLTAVSGSTLNFGAGEAWARTPGNGLRYLTCHDNLTLHDKLRASVQSMNETEVKARVGISLILQLTSLGPVLLHGGVEFMRSKPYRPGHDGRKQHEAGGPGVYDANTYKAPDSVNNIDWRLKAKHPELSALVAGLIGLRSGPLGACLRREDAPSWQSLTPYLDPGNPAAVGYGHNDDRSCGARRMRVFVNADAHNAAHFEVDFDGGPWRLVCDGVQVEPRGLGPIVSGSVPLELAPLAAAIFVDGFNPPASPLPDGLRIGGPKD